MPLQSREVVTLRLILDCDVDDDDESFQNVCLDNTDGLKPSEDSHPHLPKGPPASLLTLPSELRLKILRYVLRLDCNREQHTRRVPRGSIDHMLHLDSRRILESPQFRHKKSKQEINGTLPIFHTCRIHPAVLSACKILYAEGLSVLYRENKVLAIHCGIRGLGSKFRNFGIPLFGPLAASRAISPLITSAAKTVHKRPDGYGATFLPVISVQGKNSTQTHPFYICSVLDAYDLIHGLWIMVKSPFAKGMSFNITLTNDLHFGAASSSDTLTRKYILPWMHNHIESVFVGGDDILSSEDEERMDAMQKLFKDHYEASEKEANVYTYTKICELLESLLHEAEAYVSQERYLEAEVNYERVCYEACSMVRTRTGKLVDVSSKIKDGINRVCKLIAVSAFRLCELRSGAIINFKKLRPGKCEKPKTLTEGNQGTLETSDRLQQDTVPTSIVTVGVLQTQPAKRSDVSTTRLRDNEAIEHALLSGLLAMRLPCATPVPEWNIRLNTILLDLFRRQKNWGDALWCVRRLHQFFSVLVKEAKTKNKKAKQEVLEAVVTDLNDYLEASSGSAKLRSKAGKVRSEELHGLVAHSHDVARRLWGERLTPRKGYVGLIWTFRWA